MQSGFLTKYDPFSFADYQSTSCLVIKASVLNAWKIIVVLQGTFLKQAHLEK
jgi:hypothetical protein